MKTISLNITAGIGDIINIRGILDGVKNNYDQINIAPNYQLLVNYRSKNWLKFTEQFCQLLFSKPPYKLISTCSGPNVNIINIGLPFHHSKLIEELCVGEPLLIDEKYIVLTTKIRYFHIDNFRKIQNNLKNTINKLSKKYKIVLMGEREVEKNIKEYSAPEIAARGVYSIYGFLKNIIPPSRLIDLTISKMGNTAPDLKKLQQDCLIMNKSEGIICFGYGGNLILGASVGKVVGLLQTVSNYETYMQKLYSNTPDVYITTNINNFFNKLGGI